MKRFVIIVALQLALIVGLVAERESTLRHGRVVRLRLAPVDPRALLQGDYVILRYVDLPRASDHRGRIAVVLGPKSGAVYGYRRDAASGEVLEGDEVLLSGRVDRLGRVDFGVGQFFVAAGTGREVEREARFAWLRVAPSGEALVERLE